MLKDMRLLSQSHSIIQIKICVHLLRGWRLHLYRFFRECLELENQPAKDFL